MKETISEAMAETKPYTGPERRKSVQSPININILIVGHNTTVEIGYKPQNSGGTAVLITPRLAEIDPDEPG
jgi:hypothetical protein